jgi:hypothetical protein
VPERGGKARDLAFYLLRRVSQGRNEGVRAAADRFRGALELSRQYFSTARDNRALQEAIRSLSEVVLVEVRLSSPRSPSSSRLSRSVFGNSDADTRL